MATQTAEKVTPIKDQRKGTEVELIGKLQTCSQVGTDRNNKPIFENIIILPAEDEYSHPERFCVKSQTRLGADGQEIGVKAVVRCRPWKDQSNRYRYPHELWAV